MNTLSPLQQIDNVLEVLKNDRGHISFYDLYTRLKLPIGAGQELLVDGDILLRILEKLVRDKYVYEKPSDNGINYAITIEGVLFIGYENKETLDMETIESLSIAKAEAKKYARHLLLATWSAGIAAGLLLIWQVFLWLHPFYSKYPYILFGVKP